MLSHSCHKQRTLHHHQRHRIQPSTGHHIHSCRAAQQCTRKNSSLLGVCEAAAGAEQQPAGCVNRRQALQAAAGALLLLPPALSWPGAAVADEAAAGAAAGELQVYVNSQQQYKLSVPAGWDRRDKAGADVLFEDPGRRSTSVGVTVSPVRVASIEQFGDLEAVGQRLLDAERKKESTREAVLLASSSRRGSGGALLFDYEYSLDSTRGLKRILNTVTITGSKLYILNANFKCDKEAGCGPEEGGTIALLRQVAASFDAGASQ
uniref:PsbP C-terminal domain-containing protein n=1 Tax=Tetradesmus obliquus TaxID=3088 RepID=A0A383VVC7_TETOB|eukprot:jgi/Sobl393_1/11475/SZX69437.1